MKQLSIGALAVAATLQVAPVIAQQNTASMTQKEIRDRVMYLCNNVAIGSHIRNSSADVCEYSSDGGQTWTKLAGGAAILGLLGLGYIFRMRQRKKDEKAFANLNDVVAEQDDKISANPFTSITEIPNRVNPEDLSTSTDVVPQFVGPIMVQEAPLQIGTSPLGIGYTDSLQLEYTPKDGDEGNVQDTSDR